MASTPVTGDDPLLRYAAKRDFKLTPEPVAAVADAGEALSFVVQKHWASRLHYDFRLEWGGVLLSWAVPKGPSFDPKQKRMAIHVEDHPVSYGAFEGTIPAKQYGAGTVIVWDRGSWEPVGDVAASLAAGKLVFSLHGEKLAGLWELVRIAKPGDRQEPWILFKKRDAWARPLDEYDVVVALPDSVVAKPLGPVEAREPKVAVATPPAPADRTGKSATESAAPPTPGDLPGAVAAALPGTLAPQLATLAREVPASGTWCYEVKFDGYRLLARVDGGTVQLFTRQGNDWTAKMRSLADAVGQLGIESAWLDGEIVVLGDDGMPSFNALQNAFDASQTDRIVFFLFDVPFCNGYDLRRVRLQQRRALLAALLAARPVERIRFSDNFSTGGGPEDLLRTACAMHLEGVIAKRVDAPYVSSRSPTWLKLKCNARQEFVIGGFTDRAGSTSEVGSLLLGYHDAAGVLRYAGNVGTGWNSATSAELRRQLASIESAQSPFEVGVVKPGRWSKRPGGGEHWVRPERVAEIAFAEWTPDGSIRHASFQGLRDDKPAAAVVRELPAAAAALEKAAAAPAAEAPSGALQVKHPRAAAATKKTRAAESGGDPMPTTAPSRRAARKPPAPALEAAAEPTHNAPGSSRSRARAQAAPTTKSARSASAATPAAAKNPNAPRSTLRSAPPAATTAQPKQMKISNPDRVIDLASGLKKIDLVRYYQSVADRILPHLAGRPVSLVRGPSGVGGQLFFQKHDDKLSIPGMRELDASLWPGHGALLEVPGADALAYAAQMNVIEFHTWNSRADRIDQPDRMVFDLDPGEGVGWPQVQEAALLTRTMLTEIGLESWLKTSGGKGLHVVVPIAPRLGYDTVKGFSQAVVQHMAQAIPSRFVAKSGPANRVGKIFIDYLRNGHGATTAAAFSARARPGLGVSMPVAWEHLPKLKGGDHWTVANARDHLSFEQSDPWAAFWTTRQTLTAAMKSVGYKPQKAKPG